MCSPAAEQTLTRLTPKLRRISQAIAWRDPSGFLDPDDILQEMAVVLLERSARDPNFLEQKDAYIVVTCVHAGGTHPARHERMNFSHHEQQADDEWLDLKATNELTPEQQAIDTEQIRAVSAAVMALTPENQQVIRMLYYGYDQKEIAATMGVSPPAVTQRKATIRKTLEEYL